MKFFLELEITWEGFVLECEGLSNVPFFKYDHCKTPLP